MHRVQ